MIFFTKCTPMAELDLGAKLLELGASGIFAAALLMMARWYLPRFDRLVESLTKLTQAIDTLDQRLETMEQRTIQTQSHIFDIQMDIAGMYSSWQRPRPSRKTTKTS